MTLGNVFTFTAGWQEMVMIILYFLVLIWIGWYAYKKSTSNLDEYMLGGRNIGPWVTALSAGASDMSGWMLMGLPGEAYTAGVSAAWIAIGLTIGAYVNYLITAPRLRVYSEVSNNSITLPEFFANRFRDNSNIIRIVSGLVIVVFFAVYTASGMVAGGKLFENAFNTNYFIGLFIVAAIVIIYTFLGGYLAVSLTDLFQGVIMFIAMVIVPITAYFTLTANYDVEPLVRLDELAALNDVSYLSLFAGVGAVTIISGLAWGLGYFGQPHIIIRFMSARSHKILPAARRIGISWMAIALLGSVTTGILGVVFIDTTAENIVDPETILILMSQVLFNPFVGGFFLAAILAAIMSTISSQLLVTSSSLVQDFFRLSRDKFKKKETKTDEQLDRMYVGAGRISVVLVAIVAIIIAWDDESVVLDIVANAWAGFGAAFGPLVILALHWKKMTRSGAIASIVTGAATVILWVYVFDEFGTGLYSIIPGFILATIAGIVVSLMTQKEITQDMKREFVRTTEIVKEK